MQKIILSFWSQSVDEVVESNEDKDDEDDDVEHDLSVSLASSKHLIDSTKCVSKQAWWSIKVISHTIQQSVVIPGLGLDVHGQGLEERGLLAESVLIISVLSIHRLLGQICPPITSWYHADWKICSLFVWLFRLVK